MSNKVKQSGGLNLAQGLPGFPPPEALLDCLSEIRQNSYHQYPPAVGNASLLDVLHDGFSSYGIGRSQLMITNGATEAISLLYLYLSRKFKQFATLSFNPAYESFIHLPRIFGHTYHGFEIPENGQIDLEAFRQQIIQNEIKLVFLASPGNPLGKIFSQAEMDAIVEMAEELGFYLIIDMVYKDLYYDILPYFPFASKSNKVFYTGSFSKTLSITGWRVGYLIAPADEMAGIHSVHDYVSLCSPAPLQEAIARFMGNTEAFNSYLFQTRQRIIKASNLVSIALKDFGFKVYPVQGGYFIWAELPPTYHDGFNFAVDLYEKVRLAIVPGIHFSPTGTRFVRFSIARPENEIDEALLCLKNYLSMK
jgi:aspartate/methionine/tyrosine aminotransferase